MPEQWRVIEAWPNYEVSDLGQVRSMPRERTAGGVLRPQANKAGYWHVALCADGVVKRVRIHKLVLEAFVGPCPEGQEARHLDDNRDDNRLANLVWGTRRENRADLRRTGGFAQRPRARRAGGQQSHCRRQHELSGDNVYVGTDGRRRCRTCGRERFARHYAKKVAS